MIRNDEIPLSDIPDCDDTLRRLSDLLRMHMICRKRACRRNESCQGGYGPPCYLERRHLFAEGIEEIDLYRAHWDNMRKRVQHKLSRTRL